MKASKLFQSALRFAGAMTVVASPADKLKALHRPLETHNELTNYGILLYPDLQLQDVSGPIDPLQMLAHLFQLNLYTIGSSVGAIPSEPFSPAVNTGNSSFSLSLSTTHTYEDAPDLDVLIVPGGGGVDYPNTTAIETFIRESYPKLKYLITVCNGAGLAAKSGVFDGKRATTSKAAWASTTAYGPKVKWVSPARWIVDGNIWSASGVTSGIDIIFEFIEQEYGKYYADLISNVVEYERHTDPCWDPFGQYFNITTVEKCNATL